MKEEIYTKNAPDPIGPYSQAVRVGSVVYVSGQIGINPETGELVQEEKEEEIKQVFENISQILEAAGATVEEIVRVDTFLDDMNMAELVNEIYDVWIGDASVRPVRQTVEVSRLPKGARIEVSCIAHLSEEGE